MSLNNNVPISQHTGNGVTTSFLYDFKIFLATDLVVEADGVVKTLNVDYSITGIGNDTGDVIFNVAPANGTAILLYRAVAFSRSIEYQYQGALPSVVVNRDIERLWMAAQELQTKVVRSFQLPLSITGVDVTLQAPIPGRSIKWNATGTALIYSDQDPDVIAAAAAASAAAAAAFQAAVALDADEVEADRQAAEASAAAAAASAASIDPTKLLHTTGNETKSGILTLTNSPVVPTPTEANQAANKSYVDSASALRGHISGLMLSTAGSSATMSISAGQATDSGGVALMKLLSAISKTTSAWAVGSGNGGLDAGTIANNTWYHFYEIMRADTGVVDVNFSLSGSAPTLPANYTNFRRIGSGKTNGSGQWNRFTQNGDVFEWADPVQDVSVVNQGATSVTYALSVPPAVVTRANILAYAQTSGGSSNVYIRPLTATDAVASTATNVNLRDPTTGNGVTGELTITTNTSSQIAVRASGAVSDFKINTKGWIDRRGRDA